MSDIKNNQNFIDKLKRWHANWNLYEKLLFGINLLVTIALLIYSAVNDVKNWTIWVVFIGNIFNILSVILATKKRVICFFWGILAVCAFGAISFSQKAFGNMILYWAFYIPAQIVAWVLWYRKSNDKIEIKPTIIKWWQIMLALTITIGLIALFSWIETLPNFQKWWFGDISNKKYLLFRFIFDATILISSITMSVFVWLRFRERWILSIFIDTIQTIFWILLALGIDQKPQGPKMDADWIMMASSLTMLIAAIYGAYNWWHQIKHKE